MTKIRGNNFTDFVFPGNMIHQSSCAAVKSNVSNAAVSRSFHHTAWRSFAMWAKTISNSARQLWDFQDVGTRCWQQNLKSLAVLRKASVFLHPLKHSKSPAFFQPKRLSSAFFVVHEFFSFFTNKFMWMTQTMRCNFYIFSQSPRKKYCGGIRPFFTQ